MRAVSPGGRYVFRKKYPIFGTGMERRFKYKRDRRANRITTAIMILILGGLAAVHFSTGGTYLPAWVLVFLLCVLALCVLSIPRFIRVTDELFEIHCVVELTRIHIEDIELIQRIERHELGRLFPLLGCYGFWGYFGYYFSLREWSVYKVYATRRRNLVLIEDIYEDSYIVSCEDADELIRLVIEARNRRREEIFAHTRNDFDEAE